MVVSRRVRGANLIEYAVPTAILVASIALGLYYLNNGGLMNGIISSSKGNQSLTGGKLAIGSAGLINGLYKDSEGNINLCNKAGTCVYIPETFFDAYSEDMTTMLDNGRFESNTSSMIGTETSGAVGVENVAYSDETGLNIYTSLLDLTAEKNTDANAQELLDNLAAYGHRIDDIENNLLDKKEEVDEITKQYEDALNTYLRAKQIFEKQMESIEGLTIRSTNLSQITNPLAELDAAYEAFTAIRDDLQSQVNSKLAVVNSEYSDLANNTGVLFDQTIEDIEESPSIEDETKDLVLPVSLKMSAVKDTVEVVEQEIQSVVEIFNEETETYDSCDSVLSFFNITIDYDAGNEHVNGGGHGGRGH